MKYLILLLAILGAVWWLRRPRKNAKQRKNAAAAADPQEMTRCLDCGLHLPRGDAVTGAQGLYCCESHRQRHEG